ncbi:MAG: SpoIIE family protein phosphatase [Melioribacteraceae bacterium]|nr:SpoIIE family protein phosphatase [Melioribacteraceae bacterium]
MKHILIAEDESSARLTLSFVLKGEDYSVTAVADGEQAYNEIIKSIEERSGQIDLIISDIQMPHMTGLELIKKLYDEKIEIPTIVITAFGEKEMLIDLMRLGCSDYLDKPFEPEEIIQKVEEVFERVDNKKLELEQKDLEKSKELGALKSKMETYKFSFDKLKEQVDSAVGSYNDLVEINETNLKINISYKIEPLSNLGGDFIAVANTENGCDVIIADVAGHDMGASYHTILIKTLFEKNILEQKPPNDFLKLLNHVICENGSNERMVTAAFIRVNLIEMTAEFVSAGHPYPIIIEENSSKPSNVNVNGDVLGIYKKVSYESEKISISKKDKIFLYTDGLTGLKKTDGESGNKIRINNNFLIDSLIKNYDNCLHEIVDEIWTEANQFSNYKHYDDMTLLGIEIK